MARKTETAEEIKARLQNDMDYQRRMAQRKIEREAFERALILDEQGLVSELRSVDRNVSSVWDLVNAKDSYPAAIPILLRHLEQEHHPRIREGIVRALITKDARGAAAPQLLRMFKSLTSNDGDLKYVVALAIAATATSNEIDEILSLVRETQHGIARGKLLHSLRECRVNSNVAVALLAEFRDDPDTAEDANKLLKHFRAGGC
jgi:hypothetical protein